MPEFGKVIGQFLTAIVDGPDVDLIPDLQSLKGTITFTPNVTKIVEADAIPNPVVYRTSPIVGRLNTDGYLTTPTPEGLPGEVGVWLMATDDPSLNPTDTEYVVSYSLTALDDRPLSINSHSIAVPTDSTIDLALVIPPDATVPIGIAAAEAAAALAIEAANSAVKSVVAGTNVTVDNTDPQHPIVSSTGGGEGGGADGKSAYQVAVDNGFVGTVTEWLASLKGEPGDNSTVPGPPGISAYQVAVDNGFVGDEAAWLASLEGEPGNDSVVPGPPGDSAYEVAVAEGFVGTEAEWLESLVGPAGSNGFEAITLGPSDPVPGGLAAGTFIFRTQ